DQLLRLNAEMIAALDGAYRPGEIYLLGLQRASSLAFATRLGRVLVRLLLLPFGVAFVALKGIEEMVHLADKLGDLLSGPATSGHHAPHPHAHLVTPWSFGALSAFLVLLFNVAPFRRAVGRGFRLIGLFLRGVLIDAPVWVLHHPLLRAFLESPPVAFFRRRLAAPLLGRAPRGGILTACGADLLVTSWGSGGVFVVLLALLNTRFGHDVQEVAADRFLRFWRWLLLDIFPGLFRWVMRISRWFLEGVDRLL